MNFKKGFSLIEVMIIVAIIGILSLIAHPMYAHYVTRVKILEVVNEGFILLSPTMEDILVGFDGNTSPFVSNVLQLVDQGTLSISYEGTCTQDGVKVVGFWGIRDKGVMSLLGFSSSVVDRIVQMEIRGITLPCVGTGSNSVRNARSLPRLVLTLDKDKLPGLNTGGINTVGYPIDVGYVTADYSYSGNAAPTIYRDHIWFDDSQSGAVMPFCTAVNNPRYLSDNYRAVIPMACRFISMPNISDVWVKLE